MHENIKIKSYVGKKAADLIPEIAKLRIEIFQEYPFLYVGDYDYEMRYLNKFLTMENSIVVTAFDKEALIGISTGYPFIYETDTLKNLFISSKRKPEDFFCFGESVLQKKYRRQGIGKRFFDERELHAAGLKQYKEICFYTSIRALDDPRRPQDYRPLGPFWQGRGYKEHQDLIGTVSYQEIGEEAESLKKMIFWTKPI